MERLTNPTRYRRTTMTKAQETKARRAAVLAILGDGWKGEKGTEGRDQYRLRRGSVDVLIVPARTVDGNFYVGHYDHKLKRPRGFTCAPKTIEEARDAALRFAA
ncbi:hypothetical protein QZM91_00395 [Burkholderia multivorans]|uniref:hypothetical protein n=1 Tax=Burkholderia multivorans TaxID=87883 RepID=UPI001C2271EB|nr:hypothetical protein [Burkholderia multivorans]MBU9220141.1 hypothetical protein [Burkholderia multivorans]MBU9417945.1 hypothetical protein [Burkholderia multivorans]MDN7965987.1 hypothetical protein [Burkholderia multivorans]